MRAADALFAAMLLGISAAATAQEFPAGWRLPTTEELSAQEQRINSPRKFAKTAADFNGDGVIDEAYLLWNDSVPREALWVLLSGGPDGFRWIKLAERSSVAGNSDGQNAAMGLDALPPGVHGYGCFDGVDPAKECDWNPKTRPRLKLRDSSLAYFQFDGPASLFFWSNSRSRFMRVWTRK